MSRGSGPIVLQVGALELLARYSMNTTRATSALSSLYEFRTQEAEEVAGNKQMNWKYLRDQFDQKDLEGLYRKYDDKLRESLIYIYISLLIVFSSAHLVAVVASTYQELVQWHSTYLSMAMFALRIGIPSLFLWNGFYKPLKKKFEWIPITVTFIITLDLVLTDIAIPISSSFDDIALRPAYYTVALLTLYIFLPLKNNFITIILGVATSIIYVLVLAIFSYDEDPQIGLGVSADIIYLLGVNLMGTYFRLMNEIVTRRSFLDRRACVESTLRLKFVRDQEERLMLSILPEHIVSRVRQDIRNMFLGLRSHSTSNMRSINKLYIEEHDNVSILYADVVNYTMISTTLPPMRMIELLNELFSRFDDASEENEVLRIKFLGDCYYCVSGVPKPNPHHAKSCVDFGLEMIHIIKDVREKRSLNIDMRIGVHSGKILSGLIGIRKWQFDIWSKDVTIANKMESTGKAGKVHITQQTLEQILDHAREYIIEPNFDSQNDPFIAQNRLETYLLSKPARTPIEYKPFRRASVGFNKIVKKSSTSTRRSEQRNSANMRRTTSFMDDNLVEYQQMLKAADAQMAKEIEDMTNGREHFKKESKLNMWTLMYKSRELEKKYLLLPDPLFKYYITCCLVIFLLISFINGLKMSWNIRYNWYGFGIFGILLTFLLLMQPLTWFQFLWTKYKGIEEPRNPTLRWIYDTSSLIIKSTKIRTMIYLMLSFLLGAFSVINVIACSEVVIEDSENYLSNCVSAWHVTHSWGLALLLNFLFSRVFFIFKWVVAVIMTMFYQWIVWEIRSPLFAQDTSWNVGLDSRISHTMSVIFITITLYWIDRTTEYRNRLDHLWQIQLKEEQEEAETMLNVNNMLLENILPAHVVQVYLNLNRPIDELYYEKYDNVAVMFASLIDYKLGAESKSESNDKQVVRILDEVVSDFDKLLLTGSTVYKVEKIKMAGWTYMAACGLDPNRRESHDSTTYDAIIDKRQNAPYNKAIVLTMVEFAASIMMQLQNFNKVSYQKFHGLNLRIGVSNGEIAAGVVGAHKPLYDIWGHAVNMASRMDSTGERGKIQVTETTALILDDCGILTTFRGNTFVKGAGYIRTYFVPLDENFNLIKKENSNKYYDSVEKHKFSNIRNLISDNNNEILTDTESEEDSDQSDTSIDQTIGYGVRDDSSINDDTSIEETRLSGMLSRKSAGSDSLKSEELTTYC